MISCLGPLIYFIQMLSTLLKISVNTLEDEGYTRNALYAPKHISTVLFIAKWRNIILVYLSSFYGTSSRMSAIYKYSDFGHSDCHLHHGRVFYENMREKMPLIKNRICVALIKLSFLYQKYILLFLCDCFIADLIVNVMKHN